MCVCVCVCAYLESSYSSVPVKCGQVEEALATLKREEKRTIYVKKSKIIIIIIICKYMILDYVYYVIKAKLSYHFVARFCSHNGKLPVITFNGSMAEMRQEKKHRGMYYNNYYCTSSKNSA